MMSHERSKLLHSSRARLFSLGLAVAVLSAAGVSRGASVEERIQRVEAGLRPSVVVKGDAMAGAPLAERMRELRVPGVGIAVIAEGKIEWAKGYGLLEAGGAEPINTETLFQAASISKPVTATGALRLVERGAIDLERGVNTWLRSWRIPANEFTERKAVTLEGLLSHSAGMTVHGFPGYAADGAIATVLQVLDGSGNANTAPIRVDVEPGTIYRYSGGGFTIAQLAMSEASGREFPELLRELVLEPAGMTRSTYRQPLPEPLTSNAARGHRLNGRTIRGRWHAYPEMAAAGLWTTPSDLGRFAINLMESFNGAEGKLLSPEMTRRMVTPVLGNYGLGWSVAGEGESFRFNHGGSNEGYRCYLVAFPNLSKGAAIMTNADGGSRLYPEILRSIAEVYAWPAYRSEAIEPKEVSAETLERYAGRYRIEGDTVVLTISVDGGRIYAKTVGQPRELLLALSHIRFRGVSTNGRIEFVTGDGGEVEGMVMVLRNGEKHRARKF